MPQSAFIVRPFGCKPFAYPAKMATQVKQLLDAQASVSAGAGASGARPVLIERDPETPEDQVLVNFDAIEQVLVKPALEEARIKGDTTGAVIEAGNIREDMFNRLITADLVVCDVSLHNPNVFYELGLRQAFRDVPFELEEAARIDGAGLGRILFNVYVPLSIPSYVAFALVSISSHWNELLWPLVITRTEELRPLTVGLNKLFNTSDTGADYGLLMAGTLMVIAPLFILFIIFQRRFIESFASSGIK